MRLDISLSIYLANAAEAVTSRKVSGELKEQNFRRFAGSSSE